MVSSFSIAVFAADTVFDVTQAVIVTSSDPSITGSYATNRLKYYLNEFIDIITKHAVTKITHLHIEQDSRFSLLGITNKEVDRCNELWELAKNAAETDEQLEQILHSELCWRYWKCSTMRSEFSRLQHPYLWMKANKDLYNDFVRMGVTRMGERNGYYLSDNDLRHLTRRIYTWITLYDEPIWDALNPFAVAFYNLIEKKYNYSINKS